MILFAHAKNKSKKMAKTRRALKRKEKLRTSENKKKKKVFSLVSGSEGTRVRLDRCATGRFFHSLCSRSLKVTPASSSPGNPRERERERQNHSNHCREAQRSRLTLFRLIPTGSPSECGTRNRSQRSQLSPADFGTERGEGKKRKREKPDERDYKDFREWEK